MDSNRKHRIGYLLLVQQLVEKGLVPNFPFKEQLDNAPKTLGITPEEAAEFAILVTQDTVLTADKTPAFSMDFHQRSGRYFIKDVVGRPIQFPSDEKIHEIWSSIFPQTSFFIGNVLSGPAVGFYADVDPGTTKQKRAAFCEALAKRCTVANQP